MGRVLISCSSQFQCHMVSSEAQEQSLQTSPVCVLRGLVSLEASLLCALLEPVAALTPGKELSSSGCWPRHHLSTTETGRGVMATGLPRVEKAE